MLYQILHFYVGRIIVPLFMKGLHVKGLDKVPATGPVLLSCTHPNSFFDAILLCVLLKRPVWSLARGDVFKKAWAGKLLNMIKILPIYRLSEGKENLVKNDATFEAVQHLWADNQVVLIFSEGLCENQQELFPLKKGTARLMQLAWAKGLQVPVVPIGLAFNHFRAFNKQANLVVGEPFGPSDVSGTLGSGAYLKQFNDVLTSRLLKLLSWNFPKVRFQDNPIYFLGWVVNFPAYLLAAALARHFTRGTVHFDAVLVGILAAMLPIYWAVLVVILF